ncbi:MAG: hypothetical protein EP335_10375 [Alphaproteobacteria bacterium]|nr:MAG: hypothetical protein EP335_10375 [Alphaproteobacteria bacterium]
MAASLKLLATALAVTGFSSAFADDPFSLDGMGSMMQDLGEASIAAEPAALAEPAPVEVAVVVPVSGDCPYSSKPGTTVEMELKALSSPEVRARIAASAEAAAQSIAVSFAESDFHAAVGEKARELARVSVERARISLKHQSSASFRQAVDLSLRQAEISLQDLRQP